MVLMSTIKKARIFPILFFVVMFISFQLYGVGAAQILVFSLGPWDFVFLFFLIFWIGALFVKGSIRVTKTFVVLISLVFLFTIWVSISALFSPQPFRALTMMAQQIRNILLLFIIGSLFSEFVNIKILNYWIFWVGVSISALSVFLYLLVWSNYSEILTIQSLWKPNIIYILDQGGVLRLTGFAKDPNFYSLWMAPAFFVGLSLPFSIVRVIGILIIGLSCVLAMSRSFILAFLVSSLTLFFLIIFWAKTNYSYVMRIASILILIIIIVILFQALGFNFLDFFFHRIELIEQTPRFAMWRNLIDSMSNNWNPFFGTGLRGAQETLGGSYTHNSYFDVLFETGLPGLFLWLSLLCYVTIVALRRIRSTHWVPWIHTWLVLLVMFGAFSLVYNPFSWLISGMLCSSYLNEGQSNE